MNTKLPFGLFLLAAVAVQPLAAQNVDKSHILQNKVDEQEVREHTAAVVAQVQSLIDELIANGISGDDVKVLNATKAALTNLSEAEMDRVISSLQKAGEATNATDTQQHVVSAYTDQKGIILQFRQILRDYEQRQAAYELPVRFKELSNRQTDTMRTSAEVARNTAGKSATELTTMEQTTQGIVQADQDAIVNETNLAIDQLNKAAADSTQDDASVLQQAQADIKTGVLAQALADANTNLKAGQFLKALNSQKIARDELRHIARDLSPPADAVDALADSAAALEKLIAEQKNLLGDTNAAISAKVPAPGLDVKQGGLVDDDNTLQQDMQSTAADAAAIVKSAISPMQQSRAALSTDGLTNSVPNQNDAITKLEAADKLLQQQLADAQKAAEEDSKDPVDKLQDLKKQIETALQQQKQITAQTNAATPPDANATQQNQQNQSALEQQTSSMQQTAQPLSLAASQALATANQAMTQAQQSMTDPNKTPSDTQQQQQNAEAALTQADKQVDQQIAQQQQQDADPQALASAAAALQQAQDAASQAQADASSQNSQSSQSSQSQSSQSASSQSTPSMAQASQALAAAAADTQQAAATAGLPGAATDAVKQAQSDIAQGQQAASKGNAPGTASAAAAAEQALAQAQASVAMAQAGLAANSPSSSPGAPGSQPGKPGPPGPPGPPGMTPGTPGHQAAKTVAGGSTTKGTLHNVTGVGKFVSVVARDRAAIDQTQEEKRPQEYAPMIDQYMKNLADQADQSSSTP
jgi:hypothetical protein